MTLSDPSKGAEVLLNKSVLALTVGAVVSWLSKRLARKPENLEKKRISHQPVATVSRPLVKSERLKSRRSNQFKSPLRDLR